MFINEKLLNRFSFCLGSLVFVGGKTGLVEERVDGVVACCLVGFVDSSGLVVCNLADSGLVVFVHELACH